MQLRKLLAASAAVVALPTLAMAQPITGLYVGAGAMYNFKQIEHTKASPGAGIGSGKLRPDADGFGGVGSVGYGLGNGLRFEVEGSYRQDSIRSFGTSAPRTGQSTQQDYGVMANALYDIDLAPYGVSFMTPYVGVGAGYQWSHLNGFASKNLTTGNVAHIGGTDGNFAYQGIVGAAFPISAVPGLALTAEYRFMGILGDQTFEAQTYSNAGTGRRGNFKTTENLNHSLLLGVRYAFNTPQPAPAPVPVSAAPAVAPARTYLVFFDWDRADLTDRARQIIGEAAQNSTRVQTTRIEVQGNADKSGTPAYNQRLSLRRAQTVAAELVRDGVPSGSIDIQAFGDTRPLVQTAAGVREPQNRRVAIILR
ncbi:OmpA family protein [Acidisphaera sp. L21]|jgi:OOP family OmpA-OmpF porin|uniref:OmpA family protein n=1 Tax=Acidisphaera sp. L21 TaxID=1641851 RepID=UPI00131C77AB|nr:OmpA family protein [Acidisphaera sp. L21]